MTRVTILLCALLALPACSTSAPVTSHVDGTMPRRPVATYSIVARDSATGQIGVAVQSHWFSVGSIVPWAEPNVGAVATQSLVDPSYGPLGLAHMRNGRSAPEALTALVAGDDGRAVRQVAMIDAQGNVAVHTGGKCIAEAGHYTSDEDQFSVQANLMGNDRVWAAMARGYRETPGDLATRLIGALAAAEGEGGDLRGRQSAALLVVTGEPTGRPWEDRIFDLRVEDHRQPIRELSRLVRLRRAYILMNDGDVAMEHGAFDEASRLYAEAAEIAPGIIEIPFWHAVTLVSADRIEEALPLFEYVFSREAAWADLVTRLPASGLLPDDEDLLRRILERAPADRSDQPRR